MEQIRVIKEMRKNDKRNGRTGQFIRPRYMVWENVCFTADTLVTTKNGYKQICEVAVGDEVKTHTGNYRAVAKTMKTKSQTVIRIRASGCEDIICTPNHPLYIREKIYNSNASIKQITEPRWEKAGNLNNHCMVGYKLDEPTLPNDFVSKDEAWAIGRYIADGSVDLTKKTPRIFISIGNKKLAEATEIINRLPYDIHQNSPHNSVTNLVFTSHEFYTLVSDVGIGAGNKRVPQYVFQLPIELQEAVLSGYISGDGYIRNRNGNIEMSCSTASRELAYGIARIIRNVYHKGVTFSVREPRNTTIENREIKANYPTYTLSAALTNKQRTSICEGGFVWQMVKSVEPCEKLSNVYNLCVTEDNTYEANGIMAHNCGAFSSSKGEDFAAVLEEIVKIVEPKIPHISVPKSGWGTSGGIRDANGRFSVAWRTLDAQYWGVPQRRRRIALVADFGGTTAYEILFIPKSVCGNLGESKAKRQGTSESVRASVDISSRRTGERDLRNTDSGNEPCGDRRNIAYGISPYASNAMKSSNPHSGIYEADTSRTLDNNGGNPACNQGGGGNSSLRG